MFSVRNSPALLVAFFCLASHAQVPEVPSRGYVAGHDPSTIIKCKDRYYSFSTGQGILSKSSADKVFWSPGPQVFNSVPAWTTNAVPGFDGTFWAPDIQFFNNKYYLYYSVSSWGSQVSAIGLATSPTLDPTDPTYQWTDQGIVIQSTNGSAYNTIDPALIWDASGNFWMVFGSYWNGIYLVELNTTTGLRIGPNSPTFRLASQGAIEAAYLYRRGNYYYLFVNWGSCCDGVNSTYNLRVGRSTSVTGPYLDRDGVNLVNGGGTLFQRANGKFSGPGHVGILNEEGREWLGLHYYDANAYAPEYGAYGRATMEIIPLSWTSDNWPVFNNDWSAIYKFDADARDSQGQYSGLLKNSPGIDNDPTRGHILDLNGTNQHVWLPPGVGYGQTYAAVVKWRGGGAWQRIFDFGFDTSRTFMLTPASGDNVLRCDINPGGNLQTLQWNQPLPTNVWTHVAVALDGSRGTLYVNGASVATNTSMTFLPLNVVPQTNHLGRSKFPADPYFNGQFSSFRAYSRALSPTEIIAPIPEIAQPSDNSSWPLGSVVTFSGTATDFADVPIAVTGLTWTVKFIEAGTTNTIFGPSNNLANGSFTLSNDAATTNGFCQIALTATDSIGRRATNFANIYPSTTASTNWSAFYAFNSGAHDSSNRFNGTLLGGASIQNDSLRGNVLNLSGSSQYVSLPMGVGAAQTISGWVKWRGGNNWQRIFDFGLNTQQWFFLTPKDGSGVMQLGITADSTRYNQIIQTDAPFPLNKWTYVTVVMNGREGILYLNGTAVGVNNSVNLFPGDVVANRVYLGRSQFPADAYFNGQLDSLYLNSSAISPNEMMSVFLQPSITARVAGDQVTLSWPDWASAMQLFTSTNLSADNWTEVTNSPVSSNGVFSVTLPMAATRFHRLQWP